MTADIRICRIKLPAAGREAFLQDAVTTLVGASSPHEHHGIMRQVKGVAYVILGTAKSVGAAKHDQIVRIANDGDHPTHPLSVIKANDQLARGRLLTVTAG